MSTRAIVWAVVGLGCQPAPPPEPGPSAVLVAHMQAHLVSVVALRDAVALGHQGKARIAVSEFLDHSVARDLPGDWLPHVAAMGEAAIGVRDATSPIVMAHEAAALVGACGDCHAAVGARVMIGLTPASADAHGAHSQAVLHQLWAGLLRPDADVVHAAVDEFLEAVPADAAPETSEPALERVRQGDSPVELAGTVLAACVGCHAEAPVMADPPHHQVGSRPSAH